MDEVKYLFIDGGYARKAFRTAMESVFGDAGEVTVEHIVQQVQPFRTYYYDCLDDTQKNGEGELEFKARLNAQEAYFSTIRSLHGLHLQLGKLTGARNRRQKEVDVLLTVDMLTHGFNRNMTHAVLLSGDLDFRPVVEALVRGGVFVEVWYERTTGAKELYWAADLGQPLDWYSLYHWSDHKFRLTHPFPTRRDGLSPSPNSAILKTGIHAGNPASLIHDRVRQSYILNAERSGSALSFEHVDQGILERFFLAEFGAIDWST